MATAFSLPCVTTVNSLYATPLYSWGFVFLISGLSRWSYHCGQSNQQYLQHCSSFHDSGANPQPECQLKHSSPGFISSPKHSSEKTHNRWVSKMALTIMLVISTGQSSSRTDMMLLPLQHETIEYCLFSIIVFCCPLLFCLFSCGSKQTAEDYIRQMQ